MNRDYKKLLTKIDKVLSRERVEGNRKEYIIRKGEDRLDFKVSTKQLKGINIPKLDELYIVYTGTFDECVDYFNYGERVIKEFNSKGFYNLNRNIHNLCVDYTTQLYYIFPDNYLSIN